MTGRLEEVLRGEEEDCDDCGSCLAPPLTAGQVDPPPSAEVVRAESPAPPGSSADCLGLRLCSLSDWYLFA